MPFGFININKPKGITSFDVIYKLRKILGIKKIGHAGTLDPLACGVLPVAVGDATRLIEHLEDDKEYIATIKFGQSSTTYDEEGEKTEFAQPRFSKEDLLKELEKFKGDILQKPPLYSAIKIGGQKLYDIARKGKKAPEIPHRKVSIYDIELLEFDNIFAKIKVHCSKGTYIRSIANDLGENLECGAYLAGLIRTKAGNFYIEDAIEIEEINLSSMANPLDILKFHKYELREEELIKVSNGNSITIQGPEDEGRVLLTSMNKLVAIGSLSANMVKIEKVFAKG